MNPTLSTCLVLGLALAPAAAHAGDLRVTLSGISEPVGSVRAALFANGADFDKGEQTAGHFTRAVAGEIEIVFADLPPGTYGISAFHDVNANNELDKNLLGMPTEPFGFSRNARGSFGPPSFDDLSVEVGAEGVALEVELQ